MIFVRAQITTLKQNKAFIKILTKYSNFANIFSKKKFLILPKQTNLNKYTFQLKDSKKLSYKLIYSLGFVELETLKIYIKTYLKTGCNWSSKFFAAALILFEKNLDSSFYLYINYQGLNNLTIKNQYLLIFIAELDRVKKFT